MSDSESRGYRIDYEDVDVVDLMSQVRARAHRGRDTIRPPSRVSSERLRARLRSYLDVDDARPLQLQRTLGLSGPWNVTPEDLRASQPTLRGRMISGLRRLLRPLVKLGVNADLPLYKQFKINLGVASALRDLLQENAALRDRVEAMSNRIEAMSDRVEEMSDRVEVLDEEEEEEARSGAAAVGAADRRSPGNGDQGPPA